MDEGKKSISEIDEALAEIVSSFNEEYKNWFSKKQVESYYEHGNSSQEERPMENQVETSSQLPDHTIHGFTNEILFLKHFLLKRKESKDFKTLAVVGNYGVGKTTLCQVVFNDEQVREAYLPRIWVSMYREERPKEDEDPKIAVVKRILSSLGVEDEKLEHMEAEAVEEKRVKDEAGVKEEETVKEKKLARLLHALHLNLIGKKYLIVLDDVWEDNEWNQRLDDEKNRTHLSCGFPKGLFGGRVIVTSRDERLAKKIVGEEEEKLLRLFPRSDAESVWKIYKDTVVAATGIEVNPTDPETFRQELMDKSCGVPLAVRMLAMIEPVNLDEPSGDMETKKSL